MTRTDHDNLLTALHKWAWRQDENFVTEAFAHLLKHLRDHEPAVFVELLGYLTKDRLKPAEIEAGSVKITTQVTKDEGDRPDMEIRTPDHVVYVEVKVDAEPGEDQLARYRRALEREEAPNKTLVLLTRYPVTLDDEDGKPDWPLRWYEVGEKFLGLLRSRCLRGEVSLYLTQGFVEFLQERRMVMEHVGSELKGGVRAFWSLMGMLEEALRGKKALGAPSVGKDWAGYWVDGKNAWAGVVWEAPTTLWMNTEELRFDPEVAKAIASGFVDKRTAAEDSHRWNLKLDLEREHFFEMSRTEQIERIEKFVTTGLEILAKLKPTNRE